MYWWNLEQIWIAFTIMLWTLLKAVIYDEHEAIDLAKYCRKVGPPRLPPRHPFEFACIICLSGLKLLKNDFKSTLQIHLNDLMAKKLLLLDDKHFDPMPAIEYWNSRGQGDWLWKINAYSGKQTSVTHRCHLLAHATEPIADSGNSDDYTSDAGLEED